MGGKALRSARRRQVETAHVRRQSHADGVSRWPLGTSCCLGKREAPKSRDITNQLCANRVPTQPNHHALRTRVRPAHPSGSLDNRRRAGAEGRRSGIGRWPRLHEGGRG